MQRLLCLIGLHRYIRKGFGFIYECRGCKRLKGWWEFL